MDYRTDPRAVDLVVQLNTIKSLCERWITVMTMTGRLPGDFDPMQADMHRIARSAEACSFPDHALEFVDVHGIRCRVEFDPGRPTEAHLFRWDDDRLGCPEPTERWIAWQSEAMTPLRAAMAITEIYGPDTDEARAANAQAIIAAREAGADDAPPF